jgi:hypothetical protein
MASLLPNEWGEDEHESLGTSWNSQDVGFSSRWVLPAVDCVIRDQRNVCVK